MALRRGSETSTSLQRCEIIDHFKYMGELISDIFIRRKITEGCANMS